MVTKKKKRTITPEHLAKMQEGKKRAKLHRDRVEQLSELDERLKEASKSDSNAMNRLRPKYRRRRK